MPDPYRRLLAYDRWANTQSLDSLRAAGAPARALRWMAHIVGSQYTWLARLREEPAPMPVWPELDIDGCTVHLAALAEAWQQLETELTPELLADSVGYRNTKGEFWTSTIADILTHVAIHSGYHRGQIAAEVRNAGGTPAATDFIAAARQGYLA